MLAGQEEIIHDIWCYKRKFLSNVSSTFSRRLLTIDLTKMKSWMYHFLLFLKQAPENWRIYPFPAFEGLINSEDKQRLWNHTFHMVHNFKSFVEFNFVVEQYIINTFQYLSVTHWNTIIQKENNVLRRKSLNPLTVQNRSPKWKWLPPLITFYFEALACSFAFGHKCTDVFLCVKYYTLGS